LLYDEKVECICSGENGNDIMGVIEKPISQSRTRLERKELGGRVNLVNEFQEMRQIDA